MNEASDGFAGLDAELDEAAGVATFAEVEGQLWGHAVDAGLRGAPLSVAVLRIERTAAVRARFGAPIAAATIAGAAAAVRAVARVGDALGREDDLVTWVLPGATHAEARAAVARGQDAVARLRIPLIGALGLSAGVASLAAGGEAAGGDARGLLAAATTALGRAPNPRGAGSGSLRRYETSAMAASNCSIEPTPSIVSRPPGPSTT